MYNIFIEFFIKVAAGNIHTWPRIPLYHLAITSEGTDDLVITSVRCSLPNFGKGQGKYFCSKLMDCP